MVVGARHEVRPVAVEEMEGMRLSGWNSLFESAVTH